MSVKFKYLEVYTPTEGHKFEKEMVKRGGKMINVNDWIQAGRDDTEIYPTLEKYGCIDRMELDSEGVYADLTQMTDLRGSLERAQMGKDIWSQIPLEIRNEFNNDVNEFMDRGMDWAEKKIKKEKEIKLEKNAISGVAESVTTEKAK